MSEFDDMLALVGRFYESALAPETWESTLEAFGNQFGGAAVSMPLSMGNGILQDNFSARLDFSVASDEVTVQAQLAEDNSFARLAPTVPLVTPIYASAYQSDREFKGTLAYQHLLRPQKLFHSAGAVLLRENSQFTSIGILRPDGLDDFDQHDHDRLCLLLPHLSRAMQVQVRLRVVRAERDAALAALDLLPMGVVLVDRDGRVITMNRAAEGITDMADGLHVTGGLLRAERADDTAALGALVASAAATGAREGIDPGGAMAVPRPSMLRPLSVLVAPLRAEILAVGTRRPAAIVFVSDPEDETETPEAVLARIYGLTPAEARLGAMLMQGHGLEWSAEELGISINTARTHIKNLFEKTGVRRQAELVRLVLRGPGGLRPS